MKFRPAPILIFGKFKSELKKLWQKSHCKTSLSGVGELIQPSLCLLGKAGEHHGNYITTMPVTSAGYYYACAMYLAGISVGLKSHGHFCPCSDGCMGTKFHTVFANSHLAGRKIQASLRRLNG
ncbi:MAG: hypothetical protein JWQ71_2119 [Pedosphaera sp.]|nr:hypothetical protein [Pedosphaera sp.]